MKVLLLCTCILIASSTSSKLRQHLKNAVQTVDNDARACLAENNMTHGEMFDEADIMTNLHTEPGNEERTRKNGCVIACLLKKQELMEDSNIKESKIHSLINKEFPDELVGIAHKIARKCLKQVKSITDECEKGFSLYACVARAVHKVADHEEHTRKESEEEEEEEEEGPQTTEAEPQAEAEKVE
ncbi:hypothetical protein PUN28_002040 [Cardiocondyla obscurior]|uniref:Pheromone-binding protein Gp-9 n=1 Tax=Cardiocondyla obscurior TaxID=286306 RepID=A0AAW2GSF6_9HYME